MQALSGPWLAPFYFLIIFEINVTSVLSTCKEKLNGSQLDFNDI